METDSAKSEKKSACETTHAKIRCHGEKKSALAALPLYFFLENSCVRTTTSIFRNSETKKVSSPDIELQKKQPRSCRDKKVDISDIAAFLRFTLRKNRQNFPKTRKKV